MKSPLTFRKTLYPDKSGEPFIHLEFRTEYEGLMPQPGTLIKTGSVETMVGEGSYFDGIGSIVDEFNPPDLERSINEVKKGRTQKAVLQEHLAAGWKIAKPPKSLAELNEEFRKSHG